MSSTRLSVQLADRDWRVLAFEAQEAIGEPYRIVLRLVAEGVTTCVELGPGTVLAGLIKKIDRSVKVLSVEDPDSFAAAMEQLEAQSQS